MTTFVTGVNVKTKVGLSTEVVTSSIMGQKSDEALESVVTLTVPNGQTSVCVAEC